jgi:NitT/TauT family transport system permease protein
MCWKAGVAAEVIGLPSGSIGERLYQSKIYLETAQLFAWTAVIILASVLLERFLIKILEYIQFKIEGGSA